MSKTGAWALEEQEKEQEKIAAMYEIEEHIEKATKQLEKIKDKFTTEHIVVHAYCLSSFVLLNKANDYIAEHLNAWEQKEFEDSYEPPNIPNETGTEKKTEPVNEKPFG